jgi:hypothetical protein
VVLLCQQRQGRRLAALVGRQTVIALFRVQPTDGVAHDGFAAAVTGRAVQLGDERTAADAGIRG